MENCGNTITAEIILNWSYKCQWRSFLDLLAYSNTTLNCDSHGNGYEPYSSTLLTILLMVCFTGFSPFSTFLFLITLFSGTSPSNTCLSRLYQPTVLLLLTGALLLTLVICILSNNPFLLFPLSYEDLSIFLPNVNFQSPEATSQLRPLSDCPWGTVLGF